MVREVEELWRRNVEEQGEVVDVEEVWGCREGGRDVRKVWGRL